MDTSSKPIKQQSHIQSTDCWCKPERVEGEADIYVHNDAIGVALGTSAILLAEWEATR